MIRRILLSLPLWLAYTALELTLSAIGLVIILPLSLTAAWKMRSSQVANMLDAAGKPIKVDVWKGGWLTWLWGNEEDGVIGPRWWTWERHPKWHSWRLAYVWSALRNPTNNLRFVPGINPVIDPKRVRCLSHGTARSAVVFTWQGAFSGLLVLLYLKRGTYRIWWGWKLKPADADGVPDSDMRKPRCGFAIQFKRVGA